MQVSTIVKVPRRTGINCTIRCWQVRRTAWLYPGSRYFCPNSSSLVESEFSRVRDRLLARALSTANSESAATASNMTRRRLSIRLDLESGMRRSLLELHWEWKSFLVYAHRILVAKNQCQVMTTFDFFVQFTLTSCSIQVCMRNSSLMHPGLCSTNCNLDNNES